MGSDRSRAWRAAFAIPFATILHASPAFAQQPNASDRETARSLMAEGREKRDAGDLPAALKAFVAADPYQQVANREECSCFIQVREDQVM